MNFDETKERALCILDFRMHSRYELKTKLLQKGAEADIAEAVLDELADYGVVNDSEFARALIRHLAENKMYGKRRIKSELSKRGVDSETANIALEEFEFDEKEQLYPLVERKLNGDFEKKSIDRTVRYFANHGYNIGDIFNCINLVKENYDEE